MTVSCVRQKQTLIVCLVAIGLEVLYVISPSKDGSHLKEGGRPPFPDQGECHSMTLGILSHTPP